MLRMSTYSSQSEFVKDIKRIEGDLDTLHRGMREEFDGVIAKYNDCVDEQSLGE